MPTGYTEKLRFGQSFEEYALRCARNIGCLVHMREESLDAPIRLRGKDEYYSSSLASVCEELDRLSKMNNTEAEEFGKEKIKEIEKNYSDALNDILRAEKNYRDMYEKVAKWDVPQEYQILREFMLSQISESINVDCSEQLKSHYIDSISQISSRKPRDVWQSYIDTLTNDKKYYESMIHNEDEARVESDNRWILGLYDLLGLDKSELINTK